MTLARRLHWMNGANEGDDDDDDESQLLKQASLHIPLPYCMCASVFSLNMT